MLPEFINCHASLAAVTRATRDHQIASTIRSAENEWLLVVKHKRVLPDPLTAIPTFAVRSLPHLQTSAAFK